MGAERRKGPPRWRMREVSDLLAGWLRGERLGTEDELRLRRWEVLDPQRSSALLPAGADAAAVVAHRLADLERVWPSFRSACRDRLRADPEELLGWLWLYWLPLARRLERLRGQAGRPLVHGIAGPPACGKSTLAAFLALLLERLGCRALILSLDDLYLPSAELELLRRSDRRLQWRGPPGTHDVELGRTLLSRLRAGEGVEVPRFDKSARGGRGDRAGFERSAGADVVLFEGWFVGLRPRAPAELARALPAATPAALRCAAAANRRLAGYAPLWDLVDDLLLLYVPSAERIRRWRIAAEDARRAAGSDALPPRQAERFAGYLVGALPPLAHYRPLLREPSAAGLVAHLDARRRIRKLHAPW